MPSLQMHPPATVGEGTENVWRYRPRRGAKSSAEKPLNEGMAGRRFPVQSLIAYSLIAVWIQFLLPHTIHDPDIWWHLRDVAEQLHAHAFLRQDAYSFTAPHAHWINHEWLAELPYWVGWRIAGVHGVLFVTAAAIELIFSGVYWLAYRKSQSWPCATLVTVVASLLSTVSFGPRTLLFGWISLIAELIIFELFEKRPYVALGLPLLFLVWINLHGSWLIGLILLAVFLASGLFDIDRGLIRSPIFNSTQRRCLAVALPLSLCALLVNPYGWHLVAYPFDLAFHQALNISRVEEWRSLDLQSSRGLIFLVSLMVLFLAQLVTLPGRHRGWTLSELAFVAIGSYAAFRHCRFLFLAGILVMPIMGRQLTGLPPFEKLGKFTANHRNTPGPRMRLILNATLLMAILLAAHFQLDRRARRLPTDPQRFPEAALPFLGNFQPSGPLFNECLWGGYLTFNTPRLKVFIDSRFDIYERNGTLKDYLDIIDLNHSLALLDRHQIRYVLFERDSPLVYLLQQTHRWQPLYDDGSTILLERAASTLDVASATGGVQ